MTVGKCYHFMPLLSYLHCTTNVCLECECRLSPRPFPPTRGWVSGAKRFVTTRVLVYFLKSFTLQNPFRLFASAEHWVFTLVCMLYLAYGILSLTEAGTIEFRSKLLPTVLALPFLHPLLSYFASPQSYLSSWGVQSFSPFYDH